MVYPFMNTIYLSLTNWNGVADQQGLRGSCELREDGRGRGRPEGVLQQRHLGDHRDDRARSIGLFLALLVWSGARGSLIFRTLFFLPFVLPLVVVGLVWQWIYHPLYGT